MSVKKNIFFHVIAFIVSKIFPIKSLLGKKSAVNNVRHSSLSASCDTSFESSEGVLFKNIYFYYVKVDTLPDRESYHITTIV